MSADILAGMAAQHGTTLEELRALPKVAGKPQQTGRLAYIRLVRVVVAIDAMVQGVREEDIKSALDIADVRHLPDRNPEARSDLRNMLASMRRSFRGAGSCASCAHNHGGECRLNPPIQDGVGFTAYFPQVKPDWNCDKYKLPLVG